MRRHDHGKVLLAATALLALLALLARESLGMEWVDRVLTPRESAHLSRTSIWAGDGALRLESDPENMVLLASIEGLPGAAKMPRIYEILEYGDKLYFGGCVAPINGGINGGVIAYDGEAFSPSYRVEHEDGLFRMRRIRDSEGNEYIVVPGNEQEYSSNEQGRTRLHVFDGTRWSVKKMNTDVATVHCWDIVNVRGRLHVISTWHMTSNIFSAKDTFLSAENPDDVAWTTTQHHARFPYFIAQLQPFEDRLFTQTRRGGGALIELVGARLKPSVVARDLGEGRGDLIVFGETMYVGIGRKVHAFDGKEAVEVGDIGRITWKFAEHDGELYLAASDQSGNRAKRSGILWGDEDLDAELWKLDRSTGTFRRIWKGEEENAFSLESYRGRLYLGTGSHGNVYVSAYARTGEFVSEVRDMNSATVNYGRIVIDADSVKGTSYGVQIRTAKTKEALASRAFVGPYRKTDACFTGTRGRPISRQHDGERYIQYKVVLRTSDPRHLTPVFRSITIRHAE